MTYRFIYSRTGPWAIHVLEVDLSRCFAGVAVKGATGAIGRTKTSTLLDDFNRGRGGGVIGGANADFFLFAPPGVPAGPLIMNGRVITGPSAQPVLAFDSAGRPLITSLRAAGSVKIGNQHYEITGWNRRMPDGLAVFDERWGSMLDTASAVIEVALDGIGRGRVQSIDTTRAGAAVPKDGALVVVGRGAPESVRGAFLGLHPGDVVEVSVALEPIHPKEAVGGRPVLVRDSSLVPEVDTEGQPGFANSRHPRTAVGIAEGGRRLFLVVVDGRRKPYSDGMTLRELGNLFLALGAPEAINLDGGGSTTLVFADPKSGGTLRVANQPSDSAGERAVGDALAIVRGVRCDGR